MASPPYTVGIMNAAGTRLYSLQPATLGNNGFLHTFDLTAPPVAGNFAEAAPPIELAGDPGGDSDPRPKMTITPDGNTVFIAGVNGVAIQPTPP